MGKRRRGVKRRERNEKDEDTRERRGEGRGKGGGGRQEGYCLFQRFNSSLSFLFTADLFDAMPFVY